MTEASNQLGDGLLPSKASASSAAYQRQMSVQSIAGASHGGRPGQALAVDYAQDRPGQTPRAGFIREAAILLPRHAERHLRGCATLAAPRLFHSVASRVSSTARLNTLAHEHLFYCLAHVPHLSSLSSSLVSAGFNNASTRGQRIDFLTQKRGA